MKKLILLCIITLSLSSCNKNDDDNNQPLPPATQTGAGIFACKVNGQSFIDTSGGYFNCFYQNVNGEYYFNIAGEDNSIEPFSINLGTFKKEIYSDEIIELISYEEGNAFGGVFFSDPNPTGSGSNTDAINNGELKLTKLDFINNIISGTFWFNVENPNTGQIIQIREGRFDTLFTQ